MRLSRNLGIGSDFKETSDNFVVPPPFLRVLNLQDGKTRITVWRTGIEIQVFNKSLDLDMKKATTSDFEEV